MTGINIPPEGDRSCAPAVQPSALCSPTTTNDCTPINSKDPVCYVDAAGCQHKGIRHLIQGGDCKIIKDEITDSKGNIVPNAKVVACSPSMRIENFCDMPPINLTEPITVEIDTAKLSADIAAAIDIALGDNEFKLDPADIKALCDCIKAGPVNVKLDPADLAAIGKAGPAAVTLPQVCIAGKWATPVVVIADGVPAAPIYLDAAGAKVTGTPGADCDCPCLTC
jgi:hypothetical protein